MDLDDSDLDSDGGHAASNRLRPADHGLAHLGAMEIPATRALYGLIAELNRLRREGIPSRHTWSAVLVPLAWLSLPSFSLRFL